MGAENINFIANYLLAKGANKNAVIGVLVNMGTESSWWPYADEKPYLNGYFEPYSMYATSHGYGLVQYSYKPIVQEIWDYNHAGHTEQECIKHELDILWDEMGLNSSQGASWLNKGGWNLPTIKDFWKNIHGYSALDCTSAFRDCFERGGKTGSQRWNNPGKGWDVVSQYVGQWDGNVPDLGGDVIGPKEPEKKDDTKERIRKFTLQECLAFLDKARPKHTGTTTDPIGPDGPGPTTPPQPGSGAMKKVWDVFNEGRAAGLIYSQPMRQNWPHNADCSSFVSRCISAYLGVPYNGAVNTDSLHAYIEGLGWHKVYEGDKRNMPLDSKEADIIITGVRGQSGGNAGHTLWVCDSAGNTIECTGVPAYPPYGDSNYLCKSTLQAQRDVWLTSSYYWYKYRR